MAPVPDTEDFYMILEVERSAAHHLIVGSYRRLARKLHPDRNKSPDATAEFQLLARAYETLSDESKRRDYDLTYNSSTRGSSFTGNGHSSKPPPASAPHAETLSDAVKITAIQNSKQERCARWQTTKDVLDASISKLQREIRQIEQEIRNLNSITAAEVAVEAQKNSWGTWLLSPFYKTVQESEDVKARKDRERQERRIEKDMKERRLVIKKTELRTTEDRSRKAYDDFNTATQTDDEKIRVIRNRIRLREERERQEKETAERQRAEKLWREHQEEMERHQREAAAEILRKHQAEMRAAEEKRRQEEARTRQPNADIQFRTSWAQSFFNSTRAEAYQPASSTCLHRGWWSKETGFALCPSCNSRWNYLLQCPSCKIKACPQCQANIRPKRRGNMSGHQSKPTYAFEETWPDYDL